jgi:hypothetical protein
MRHFLIAGFSAVAALVSADIAVAGVGNKQGSFTTVHDWHGYAGRYDRGFYDRSNRFGSLVLEGHRFELRLNDARALLAPRLDGVPARRVFARGGPWLLCSGRHFTGHCLRVRGEARGLHSKGLDRVRSARPLFAHRDPYGFSHDPFRRDGFGHDRFAEDRFDHHRFYDDRFHPPGFGKHRKRGRYLTPRHRHRYGYRDKALGAADVVLFSRHGFSGPSVLIHQNIANLAKLGFNDRTTSIRVRRGVWEVCSDAGFKGRCIRITSSRSLKGFYFDKRISSLRRIR